MIDHAGLENLPEDAKLWASTAGVLKQLAEAIPRTDWIPRVPAPKDLYLDEDERHVARQALLASHHNVLKECIDGFSQWFVQKTMPELSEPAKYWLLRTANSVAEFCESQVCQLNHPPETIVPYPPHKPMAVCYWLLGDWWAEVGLKRFVAQATTDQSLFYGAHM